MATAGGLLPRPEARKPIQERAPQTAILSSRLGRPGPRPPRRVPSPDSGRPQGIVLRDASIDDSWVIWGMGL